MCGSRRLGPVGCRLGPVGIGLGAMRLALRPTRGVVLGSTMGRSAVAGRRGRGCGPVWPREIGATSRLPRYGSRSGVLVAIFLGRRKWLGTRRQPLGRHLVHWLACAAKRTLRARRNRRGPLARPALRGNRGWPRPAVAGPLRFVVAARFAARVAHVARLSPASAIHVSRRLAAPRRSMLGRATPPGARPALLVDVASRAHRPCRRQEQWGAPRSTRRAPSAVMAWGRRRCKRGRPYFPSRPDRPARSPHD